MLESSHTSFNDTAVVLMHDALGPGAQRAGCRETVELIEPLSVPVKQRGLHIRALSQRDTPSG